MLNIYKKKLFLYLARIVNIGVLRTTQAMEAWSMDFEQVQTFIEKVRD